MAKYTKVWGNGIETSTLHFRGLDFILTMGDWNGDGSYTSKEMSLDIQVQEEFDDDENIDEIIDALGALDDDFDREEALETLTNLEKDDEG